MFYTVGEKYIYVSVLLQYYRFTRRRARASAFIPCLFSVKPYIHKQNRNEISVHFLVKVSHQENMCCLDCTCIRLFYVFWPAFEHY